MKESKKYGTIQKRKDKGGNEAGKEGTEAVTTDIRW